MLSAILEFACAANRFLLLGQDAWFLACGLYMGLLDKTVPASAVVFWSHRSASFCLPFLDFIYHTPASCHRCLGVSAAVSWMPGGSAMACGGLLHPLGFCLWVCWVLDRCCEQVPGCCWDGACCLDISAWMRFSAVFWFS